MSALPGSLRRLAARSAIFTFADFLRLSIAFFLIPLYTSQLAPAEYGIVSLARTFSALLTVLYLQSLESAYTRFYYALDSDERRRVFFGTAWLIHLGLTAAVSIAIEIAGSYGALSSLGIAYDPYLRLVVWTAFLTATALLLPKALFLAREQAWHYAVFNTASFLLTILLSIELVARQQRGARGALEATFVVTAVLAAAGFILILRNVRLTIDRAEARKAFAYTLPLVPHLLSLWVLSLADRIILQRYAGLADVGIYSLGYQLGAIPDLVAFALATAIDPFFYKTASSQEDARPILAKVATYYLFAVGCVGIATVGLAPEALKILAQRPDYGAALGVVPWVVAASVLRGFYFAFLAAVMYGNDTKALPLITAGAAALNIGLNLVLVPRFGYLAAAVVTVIAYAVQCALLFWRARRVYRISYEWRRIIVLAAIGSVWAAMLFAFTLGNVAASVAVKSLLLALFPAALLMVRFFPESERKQLMLLWSRRA